MASFSEAFKKARSAGKEEFSWDGKRYNTRRKGESSEEWKSNLGGETKRPKARPSSKSDSSSAPETSKRPKARPSTGTRPKARPSDAPKRTNESGAPEKSARPVSRADGAPKFRGVTWNQYTQMTTDERNAARLPSMISKEDFMRKATEKSGTADSPKRVKAKAKDTTDDARARATRSRGGPSIPGMARGGMVKKGNTDRKKGMFYKSASPKGMK